MIAVTAKSNFNTMMNEIDNMILCRESLSSTDIKASIALNSGLSNRDLNTIFTYLTGRSLKDYITERQMMAAYKDIIEMREFNIDAAIILTGYDNQSSFTKKFTECFEISPKKAWTLKDESKIKQPLSWDLINEEGDFSMRSQTEPTDHIIYGISEEKYRMVQEILDLKALYEFSEEECIFCYKLSENENVPISRAFEFCSYLFDHYFMIQIDTDTGNVTGNIKYYQEQKYLFFYNITDDYTEACELIMRVSSYGYDITEIRPKILRCYLKYDQYSFRQFLEIAKRCGVRVTRNATDEKDKTYVDEHEFWDDEDFTEWFYYNTSYPDSFSKFILTLNCESTPRLYDDWDEPKYNKNGSCDYLDGINIEDYPYFEFD